MALYRLILAVLLLAVLFLLLCGPVLAVALRLRKRGDGAALRPLRMVWLIEGIVATGVLCAADWLGAFASPNPFGRILVTIAGVGVVGAVLFGGWRLTLRAIGARR
jgi:hypothetical protein